MFLCSAATGNTGELSYDYMCQSLGYCLFCGNSRCLTVTLLETWLITC